MIASAPNAMGRDRSREEPTRPSAKLVIMITSLSPDI